MYHKMYLCSILVALVGFQLVSARVIEEDDRGSSANRIEGECETDADCRHIRGAECADTLPRRSCWCPAHYILNSRETECLPRVTRLGGRCHTTAQCISGLYGATCFNTECRCMPGFHFSEVHEKCVPSKKFGEHCKEEDDLCYEAVDGGDYNSLDCVQGTCQCLEGTKRVNDVCEGEEQEDSEEEPVVKLEKNRIMSEYAFRLLRPQGSG